MGQVVKAKVMKVDAELKRISLSMKLGEGPSAPRGSQPKREQPRKAPDSKDLAKRFSSDKDKEEKLKTYKPKFNIRQIMK